MNASKTSPKVEPARHWINGEWISSSTVGESVSPSTGEVLGQYSAGGRVEAAAAIAAARKAFDSGSWFHDPQLRSRALLELADRLEERADAIALTIGREEGKTQASAEALSRAE
jgi:betaine-aldehyde dehydrogenase